MSPEDMARIRHLIRMGNELPMPLSAIRARTSKRFSRAGKFLSTPEIQKSYATTATNVDRFMYDEKADEEAKIPKTKSQE